VLSTASTLLALIALPVAQAKKTLLQTQRESDPSVGDGPGPALRKAGPGHVLTASKHTASRDEL
jgi:hypothetical protein